MERRGRLPECVLESDDVEVAMVTGGRGEGKGGEERRGEMAELKNYLAASLQARKRP